MAISLHDIVESRRAQGKVRRSGSGYLVCCPNHDDSDPSLSVNKGDDGRLLLFCHGGCPFEEVRSALGLSAQDCAPRNGARNIAYDYRGVNGEVIHRAVRKPGKKFAQWQPGANGKWRTDIKDVKCVPYNLPDIVNSDQGDLIIITEGEKDSDRLKSYGWRSTTNSGGALNWHDEYNQYLQGRNVIIIPDNDDTGEKRVDKLCTSLMESGIDVMVLRLPDLPHKGDVSDWFDAGHTNEEFKELIAELENERRPIPLSKTVCTVRKNWREQIDNPSKVVDRVVATGIPVLNKALGGGLQRGHVHILGGDTNVGKSGLALYMAIRNAVRSHTSLIYSLEDDVEDMTTRIIGNLSEINISDYPADESKWNKAVPVMDEIESGLGQYIVMDDRPVRTADAMVSTIVRGAQRYQAKFIVVDYLQQFANAIIGGYNSPYEAMNGVCDACHQIAKATHTAVLAISQYNREGKPKGSSSIEQGAYNVLDIQLLDNQNDIMVLKLSKVKRGPCKNLILSYHAETMMFDNPTDEQEMRGERSMLGKGN